MTMKVLWHKSVGHSFAYKNGVRQGSCLSPLLFAVYIDDALKKVRSVKLGLANYSSSLIINIMAFADDIVLVALPYQVSRFYSISLLRSLVHHVL